MSRYRVAYTDAAEDGLAGMPPANRTVVKAAIAQTIGEDPYGYGSVAVGRDRDRREASVSTVIVRYEVSASVLIVTVLRAVAW